MLPAGDARGKYTTWHAVPSDRRLAAHLAGEITLAGYLVGRDRLARAWALDVDEGGPEAVRARVEALAAAGLPCIGLAVAGAGSHNGGHVWGRYAEGVSPAAAAAQVRTVLEAAGLATAEIWPSGKAIRLPLGVHTHTGRRGTLVRASLPDVELDAPGGLAAGLEALLALEASPPPPALPAPTPRPVRPARPAERLAIGEGSPIERFNAEHTVEELLERYGATRTRDGWACNCSVQHEHTTQIYVNHGRAGFYSSRCRWAPDRTDRNGRPIADAFDLFAQVEHGGDKKAAAAALRPASEPRRPRRAPEPAAEYPEADAAVHRTQEAARKREARRAEALATQQDVRDRAAEDRALIEGVEFRGARIAGETLRETLRELLALAGGKTWCRPSIAGLAARIGRCERTVQRALSWLEGRYIVTEEHERDGVRWRGSQPGKPRSTAVRTFLREPLRPVETPQTGAAGVTQSGVCMSPDQRDHESLESDSVAGEGGASSSDAEVDADVERVLARRAEAQALASMHQLVRDLAAAAGEELPPELPGDLGELEALAERLLAAADAGPVTPAGPVSFVGGCSFTPCDGPAGPRVELNDPAQNSRLLWEHWAAIAPSVQAPRAAEASTSEPEPARVKGPPRGDRARRAYFGLLGKARNAQSAKQRSYLRSQAAALEEWYTLAELQADQERRARPGDHNPAPVRDLAPAQAQLGLFDQVAPAVPGRAGRAPAPPSPAPVAAQASLLARSQLAAVASCTD